MSAYTPGPWTVGAQLFNGEDIPILAGDPGLCVGVVWPMTGEEGDPEPPANARLIAAAPKMDDLLRRLVHAFYVDGTSKALQLVMAEIRPLLTRIDAA